MEHIIQEAKTQTIVSIEKHGTLYIGLVVITLCFTPSQPLWLYQDDFIQETKIQIIVYRIRKQDKTPHRRQGGQSKQACGS